MKTMIDSHDHKNSKNLSIPKIKPTTFLNPTTFVNPSVIIDIEFVRFLT
jgi:hypothetical protein